MARESKAQQATIGRVMHAFKEGELRSGGNGRKVRNPRQAVAIALNEAGASRRQQGGQTRAALYAEARRRGIPGRSGMSKAALEKALAGR